MRLKIKGQCANVELSRPILNIRRLGHENYQKDTKLHER